MTSAALSDTALRAQIYDRLRRRNRWVSILRVIVPICGMVLCAVLVGYVYLANIAEDFGTSGITIDRDRLVIATPRYEGITGGGASYLVTADSASSQLTQPELLFLENAVFDLTRPDGYTLHAETALAHYDLAGQTVQVPGELVVTDARGMLAHLYNSRLDWSSQSLHSDRDVRIEYPDGTTILGESLIYDGEANEWIFDQAEVFSGEGGEALQPVTEEDLEF